MIGTSQKSLLVPIIMIRVIRKIRNLRKVRNLRKIRKKLLLCDTNGDAVLVVLAERLHA